nr:unnamed protein product [Callosobruchus chinensis]
MDSQAKINNTSLKSQKRIQSPPWLLPTVVESQVSSQEEQQSEGDEKPNKKRKLDNGEEDDSLADCKILRNMLEEGIKKYMLESIDGSDDDDDDSGIHKDDK